MNGDCGTPFSLSLFGGCGNGEMSGSSGGLNEMVSKRWPGSKEKLPTLNLLLLELISREPEEAMLRSPT